jgi:CheY-like chemotaxis protein/tetratricopeptide (TPR) repeat protein
MARKILYIDDQHELPDRVDELLDQAGFALVHTDSPQAALRLAVETEFALALFEVLVPDCDSFDLMRRLMEAGSGDPLPIVVVTRGERTPGLYGEALAVGARDFLCKPATAAEILEAVLGFARETGEPSASTARSLRAAKIIEGQLESEPFASLLGRLYREGASGVLRLSCGSESTAVQFRNGSPVGIEKHRHSDSIADYLRRTGRIDAEQYELLVDQVMARVAGPREILLGMDAISETELVNASREQGRGIVFELFGWSSGPFSFHPDERLEGEDTLELGVDPAKLLVAGLKATPEDVVAAALERRSNLYASFVPAEMDRVEILELSREERTQVEGLMGDRTLAEILASPAIEGRTLLGLCAMGVVVLDEAAVLMLDEVLKQDVPDETDGLENSREEAAPIRKLPKQRSAVPASPSRDSPGPAEGRVTALDTLDVLADRLDTQDDFSLFGIEEKTPDTEVRAAYDVLLSSLEFKGSDAHTEGLRERATDLRRRLDQAYQRIRTAETRRLFGGLRKKKSVKVEPKPDSVQTAEETGSRAVEAESWFRTGEGHLANDDHVQAAEAFGMAAHLDPNQGDYAAYLGWALFRSKPDNTIIRREALEHVAKGVKIAPEREQPLLFLSRIFRETGEAEMAKKVLRRALQRNPDSPALVQEMCLLDPGSSQSKRKKILDRFRRT